MPEPLDESTRAVLELLNADGAVRMHEGTPEAAREMIETMVHLIDEPGPEVDSVEDTAVPGPAGNVPVRVYRPEGSGRTPGLLVFFHGGGFVIGSPNTHDTQCRYLCKHAGVVVVSVDYRLAPEHPHPAAIEDCYAALLWTAGNGELLGADTSRLAVGGDSAGGNLSAVICQEARDKGGPAISFQLLWYPSVAAKNEDNFAKGSMKECSEGYFLDRPTMEWFYGHYVPDDMDRADPRVAPLETEDLSGLPPAFVLTAGYDPLRDGGRDYARRMREAGVRVDYSCYETTIHGFINMTKAVPVAMEALAESARKLGAALA